MAISPRLSGTRSPFSTAFCTLFAMAAMATNVGDAQGADNRPQRGDLLSPDASHRGFDGALDCTIYPNRNVELATDMTGVVKSVAVVPGQEVAQGDVIAQLDTDLLAAEWKYFVAKAEQKGSIQLATEQLRTARAKFASAEKALKSRVISQIQYEEALGNVRAAESRLASEKESRSVARAEARRAKLSVDKGTIKAPVPGVIGEDLIAPGESTIGRPIAQIVEVNPMRIEVFIPLSQLKEIMGRETHQIITGPGAGTQTEVEFDYLSPVADQSSRTIKAFFRLQSDTVTPGIQCGFLHRSTASAKLKRSTDN